MGNMQSPHGPRQSHPRAHVAWPPLADISGTHTSLVLGRETRGSRESAGFDWLPVRIGTQRCGSAALSDPTALGPDHSSCNLKPCDCQLNGSVLSVGRFQAELTSCRRNGWLHPVKYMRVDRNGWCLLFRIASWSSLDLFVLGAKIIITLFMITQKSNRLRPLVTERWSSTVNETNPWRDKREPLWVRIKMRMEPRGNGKDIERRHPIARQG